MHILSILTTSADYSDMLSQVKDDMYFEHLSSKKLLFANDSACSRRIRIKSTETSADIDVFPHVYQFKL